MEFLNELKAQPLALLVGNRANKQGGLFTLQSVAVRVCFFPLLPTESKLLRQKAEDTGLWQYVSHSFVSVDFEAVGGIFQKGFVRK